MSNDREWDNFVSSWHKRRDDEEIDCNNTAHKKNGKRGIKKHYNDIKDDRGNDHFDIQSCIESFCRSLGISVPVTVMPFAVPGKPEEKCAGEFEINPCFKCCENKCNNSKFIITKKINVTIPMMLGAEIYFDKAYAIDNGKCNDDNFSFDIRTTNHTD